ncbi:uncharacterized protein LOC135848500 isoform X2 [Planococcus citri]|uniref:uncharacterized protein LOC135848500 isoform X2 n=1 Tax=Planococcus citri TaxID=170843 RepID=UPI0031F8F8B2
MSGELELSPSDSLCTAYLEIQRLKGILKQKEPLLVAMKVRYLLEGLEEYGKPEEFDESQWIKTTRPEKWHKMFTSGNDNDPWVKEFIESTGEKSHQEVCEIVDILFETCDKMTDDFFSERPVDFETLTSAKFANVLDYLKTTLDLEMTIPVFSCPSLSEMLGSAVDGMIVKAFDSEVDEDDSEGDCNDPSETCSTTEKAATTEPEPDNQQAEHNLEEALEVRMNNVSLEDSPKNSEKTGKK